MNATMNMETAIYTRNGEEIDFNYYTNITMGNKILFVDSVVSAVVGDGYYYPMLKDMIFDFRLVQFFSDADTSTIDEDNTIDGIEEFLSETNIADVLKINLCLDVLMELYDAVDKAIEYKTCIHPSPIADGIASLLKVVEDKFSEFDMDSMTGMARTFAKMQGDITPDKMLEAYAKSDIFKKQHEDVVKKKAARDAKIDKVFSVVDGGMSKE